MNINVTDTPNPQDEEYVIDSLWAHNNKTEAVDIHPLFLTVTHDNGKIVAGLVARTWWGGIQGHYLRESDEYRKSGYGRQLMEKAEEEAIKRGCHMAYVDTFDFQARGFYEKLGYRVYGDLGGYAKKYTRHYLAKEI